MHENDQAGLDVSQRPPPSFVNYSNWFPKADNATPEHPRGAPQFQPDVSFISEQNLVLSLAVVGLHLAPSNAWRER